MIVGGFTVEPGRVQDPERAIVLLDSARAAVLEAVEHSVLDPLLRLQALDALEDVARVRDFLDRCSAIAAGCAAPPARVGQPARTLVEALGALEGCAILGLDYRPVVTDA